MTPRTIDVVARQDPASADLTEFRPMFNRENSMVPASGFSNSRTASLRLVSTSRRGSNSACGIGGGYGSW